METKRLVKYGREECNAYKELASYKWSSEFTCRNEECGYDRFFEGKRPYSRRCLRCKTDESPTAHTVFNKLRMPVQTALGLVKLLVGAAKKYKIDELAEHLNSKTNQDVKRKAVWELALKAFERMEQEQLVYDLYAVVITFSGITISWGKIDGSVKHMAVTNVPINEFVKKHTRRETVVAVYDFIDISVKINIRIPKRITIDDRADLDLDMKHIRGTVMKFKMLYSGVKNFDKYAQAYLNYYAFLRNKGTYEKLISDLVKNKHSENT